MHCGTESIHNNRQKGKATSVTMTMPKLAAADIPWASKSSPVQKRTTACNTRTSLRNSIRASLSPSCNMRWCRCGRVHTDDWMMDTHLLRFHMCIHVLTAKNNVKCSSQRSGYRIQPEVKESVTQPALQIKLMSPQRPLIQIMSQTHLNEIKTHNKSNL